ncbi:sodium:alanine symporter family protein [Candidatus Dependentiae bacterium]|nr:sodium:alanine symporter family protein [Candidatus Dependentiae bacterium]
MELINKCSTLVELLNSYLGLPSLILFLGTGIILTFKTGFAQVRAFPRFWHLITHGLKKSDLDAKTINPFHALFSAMATTIGMGNIVGPSMAISVGGPGALFWLILYIFFGSVTKFTEVTFAVYSRQSTQKGDILGGPSQYLKLISPWVGNWYALLTIFLFTGWSSIQVNTLSCIWAQEGIPAWFSGLLAISLLLVVVLGGVKRIGFVASRIVPLKFLLYVGFALLILAQNPAAVWSAIKMVFTCAFTPGAACGGLTGITLLKVMREGIYKSIFITEAGVGTSSIPHALADVEYPTDQGILAMFSGIADMFLCSLSGLLTLVTGVWTAGKLDNTLIYQAFKMNSPVAGGQFVLIISILLFVLTALIGNTYNGSQSFATITGYRYVKTYYLIAAALAFSGAFVAVPFIWNIMDVVLVCVAVPNLIGILLLAFKYPQILKYR